MPLWREFGVQLEAVLDIVSGRFEPSGLLPLQIPENMDTVERQLEDVPFDMMAYTDLLRDVSMTLDLG